MPIYEYQCRHCGETVEKIASRPEGEIDCPRCAKPAKRVVSLFSGSQSGNGCGTSSGSGFT